MEFVTIPAGMFMMGTSDIENATPHAVIISKSFELQTTLVTQEQWVKVMGKNPSQNKKSTKHPVDSVSWNDIQVFINKLNKSQTENKYRLPTEAEWEYASRGGSTGQYSCNTKELTEYAWFNTNSNNKSQPVGTKLPNKFGLYDMHGNLWEWCQDWCGLYRFSLEIDPVGSESGSYRVIRGGSFYCNAKHVRSAFRYDFNPDYRGNDIGFRLVRTRIS